MTTRTITGTLPNAPRQAVRFRLLATFVTASATYTSGTHSAACNAAGAFSIDLPVPDTGTAPYRVELPDGTAAQLYIGAGSATTLELLLAGAFAVSSNPDYLAVLSSLVSAHAALIASTTTLGHVKIDGTTITIDGSGVISSAGGGGGAPSGSAGGVLGGTYPNPTFAADMATQAELDSEASTRASADNTHAALTTAAHGGIVASTDPRLTDSRTPTAHASSHASAGSDPLTLAESQITNLVSDLAAKAPLASPAFTGTPAAPTAAGGTNTTQIATTAFVATGYQPLDSDLTTIAGLTATTDNIIQSVAGAWASRTPAQAKTALSLNNVENTALSTWAGSTNVTTLGTVATGTWNATTIPPAKGGAINPGRSKPSGGTEHIMLPGVPAGATVGASGMPSATICYFPHMVQYALTVTSLKIEVTTASGAGTVARLGLYNADTDWQPTTLVIDAGTVAVDSTGVKSITISQALAPGRYLAVFHSDGGPSLRRVQTQPAHLGYSATLGAAPFVGAMRKAAALAVLASTGVAWNDDSFSGNPFVFPIFWGVTP